MFDCIVKKKKWVEIIICEFVDLCNVGLICYVIVEYFKVLKLIVLNYM